MAVIFVVPVRQNWAWDVAKYIVGDYNRISELAAIIIVALEDDPTAVT